LLLIKDDESSENISLKFNTRAIYKPDTNARNK